MLEAVTTSVGYGDYLAETLPTNRQWFDRILVVTSPEDSETQDVCRQNGVEFVATQAFLRDGAVFRKGAGINVGLQHLSRLGWLVHLDADILLLAGPPQHERLDKTCIWTCPRYRVLGKEQLESLRRDPATFARTARKMPFLKNAYKEFCPSGYWQQWHFPTCPHWYDESSRAANGSDWRFLKPWPVTARRIIKDQQVWHLAMPEDKKFVNWGGRQSPRFA